MNDIPPDDIEDCIELIDDLFSLIDKHMESIDPAQMAATFIGQGIRIAYLHAMDKSIIPDFIANISAKTMVICKLEEMGQDE